MNIITKLPGPLLVFLGACSLSFGGLIVKSFEGATLWQKRNHRNQKTK